MDEKSVRAMPNEYDLARIQRQITQLDDTLAQTLGSRNTEKELTRLEKQIEKIDRTTQSLFASLKKNMSSLFSSLGSMENRLSLSFSSTETEKGLARIGDKIAAISGAISDNIRQWRQFESVLSQTTRPSALSDNAAIGGKRKPGCFLFCLPADASTCCKAWVCAA